MTKGRTFGGRRKAVCDHARKNSNGLPGALRDEHDAERALLTTMERNQKLMSSRENSAETLSEVVVLD